MEDEGAGEGRRDGREPVGKRRREPAGVEGRPGGRRRRAALAALALVLAAAALGALALFGPGGLEDGFFDDRAKEGQAPYKSAEEAQAELDRVVEEGMFGISIASVIPFADGASEGTAYIENVPGNRYLMRVELVRDDTGETVYASGLIEPNSHIQRAPLAMRLEEGTYACTAVFTAVDPETEAAVGTAAAAVEVAVRQ